MRWSVTHCVRQFQFNLYLKTISKGIGCNAGQEVCRLWHSKVNLRNLSCAKEVACKMKRSTLALKPMKSLKHTCISIPVPVKGNTCRFGGSVVWLLLVWVASVGSKPHDRSAVANYTIT